MSSASGRRSRARAAEQVALAGGEAEPADRRELLGGLDAFGDERRLPAGPELLQRPEDGVRRIVLQDRPGPATGRP